MDSDPIVVEMSKTAFFQKLQLEVEKDRPALMNSTVRIKAETREAFKTELHESSDGDALKWLTLDGGQNPLFNGTSLMKGELSRRTFQGLCSPHMPK